MYVYMQRTTHQITNCPFKVLPWPKILSNYYVVNTRVHNLLTYKMFYKIATATFVSLYHFPMKFTDSHTYITLHIHSFLSNLSKQPKPKYLYIINNLI